MLNVQPGVASFQLFTSARNAHAHPSAHGSHTLDPEGQSSSPDMAATVPHLSCRGRGLASKSAELALSLPLRAPVTCSWPLLPYAGLPKLITTDMWGQTILCDGRLFGALWNME